MLNDLHWAHPVEPFDVIFKLYHYFSWHYIQAHIALKFILYLAKLEFGVSLVNIKAA